MPKDYSRTDNYDLLIEAGDFKTIESTNQHHEDLLLTDLGGLRLSPYMGVGIIEFINDDDFGDMDGKIREHFELDEAPVKKLEIYEDGNVKIEAPYNQ